MLERAHTLCENRQIGADDLRLAEGNDRRESALPDLTNIDNLPHYLESIERQVILHTLEETRWNRTAAAQRLSLSFRSLRYRLKKLGLD
ncbi:Bacterial regulatory protein, Fis family [compost metagenome]